jgi:hypothetical protein
LVVCAFTVKIPPIIAAKSVADLIKFFIFPDFFINDFLQGEITRPTAFYLPV